MDADRRNERHDDADHDGGAYIGNRPEPASETIPGGVRDKDERIAGADAQSTGSGKAEERVEGRDDEWPAGHRDA